MRVAFLTTDNSMHINIKAKYFDRPDDHVYFFAIQASRSECKIDYRENIHIIRFRPENRSRMADIISHTKKMLKMIKEYRIQIVHIVDMWYCGYAITLGLSGVNVVLENNGSDVLLTNITKTPFKAFKYWVAYKCCKAVVQDSAVTQDAGIRLGARRKNNKIIELGIDTKIFHLNNSKGAFKRRYSIPDDAKVIFSPRSFLPLYNIDEIIDVIRPITEKYPNTYFVFCSYYKNRDCEKKILEAKGHTLFLGCVDNEKELPYIYSDSDIVISIPSSDSSPRTVYEAMASGCNVIISDLPWVKGRFTHGKELLIVPLHDKNGLQQVIEKVLSDTIQIDPNIAFDRVAKTLDHRVSRRELKRLYRSIINRV